MSSPVRHIAHTAIALAALLAPQFAHAAAVHIEASGVVFDNGWAQRPETLVSDVNGAATFSLFDAVDALRYPYMWQYNNQYSGMFQLSARAGYKVTGYSFSGRFVGEHYIGRSPDGSGRPGGADTSAGADSYLQDAVTGEVSGFRSYAVGNVQGTAGFTLDSGPLDRTDAFYLAFGGWAYGWASPAIWTTYDPNTGPTNNYDFSRAEIGLNGPLLLTVYTQAIAVPEPHTYALTLAGLALLAGAVRRRRHRDQSE
jgi:hypothetical protein